MMNLYIVLSRLVGINNLQMQNQRQFSQQKQSKIQVKGQLIYQRINAKQISQYNEILLPKSLEDYYIVFRFTEGATKEDLDRQFILTLIIARLCVNSTKSKDPEKELEAWINNLSDQKMGLDRIKEQGRNIPNLFQEVMPSLQKINKFNMRPNDFSQTRKKLARYFGIRVVQTDKANDNQQQEQQITLLAPHQIAIFNIDNRVVMGGMYFQQLQEQFKKLSLQQKYKTLNQEDINELKKQMNKIGDQFKIFMDNCKSNQSYRKDSDGEQNYSFQLQNNYNSCQLQNNHLDSENKNKQAQRKSQQNNNSIKKIEQKQNKPQLNQIQKKDEGKNENSNQTILQAHIANDNGANHMENDNQQRAQNCTSKYRERIPISIIFFGFLLFLLEMFANQDRNLQKLN